MIIRTVYSPVCRASSHPNLSSRYIYSEKLVVALTTQTRSEVRLNLETLHRGDICYGHLDKT
jgi:hypothetical protein